MQAPKRTFTDLYVYYNEANCEKCCFVDLAARILAAYGVEIASGEFLFTPVGFFSARSPK
jgi:hypothetical protein